MNVDQCVAFLHALGAKKVKIKGNGWVEASCPLSKWTHTKHTDNSPSFGLSIAPGERSFYSCFACHGGSAEELLQALMTYTQNTVFAQHYDFTACFALLEDELTVLPLPEYEEHNHESSVFTEWPQYWLDNFVKANFVSAAMHYLEHRKVSQTTIHEFDLRYDSYRNMIVAPYWSVFGQLAGARGRSIDSMTEGYKKHYDYSFQNTNNAKMCWYNEKCLNLDGPAVVVEGQFDCWRVEQVFPKVVANLTAKPTWEKMKKLGDCPFIIQIPDKDETGNLSIDKYHKLCDQLGIGHKVLWLDDGVKDPDECHPEYLRERIMGFV